MHVLAGTEQGCSQKLTGLVMTENGNGICILQNLRIWFMSVWYPSFH